MSNVTGILQRIARGEGAASADLLPVVYDELRRLAAARLAEEPPGQTLQATALVHEAWLRLTEGQAPTQWDHRGHFFAAAAEAMRRIVVDAYRQKMALKRGGGREREAVDLETLAAPASGQDLLALNEALSQFEAEHPRKAELVKLRYFAGFTSQEAAEALQISAATADRDWNFARAWLLRKLQQ